MAKKRSKKGSNGNPSLTDNPNPNKRLDDVIIPRVLSEVNYLDNVADPDEAVTVDDDGEQPWQLSIECDDLPNTSASMQHQQDSTNGSVSYHNDQDDEHFRPKLQSYDLDINDIGNGYLGHYIDEDQHHQVPSCLGPHQPYRNVQSQPHPHRHSYQGFNKRSSSNSPQRRRSEILRSISSSSVSSSNGLGILPRTTSIIMNQDGSAAVLQAMPSSKVDVVEVLAEQSWLITKLAVQLLWALRMSYRWVSAAIRLILFSLCLLPALLRIAWYWYQNEHVHKNIIYGLKGRNLLDVYTVAPKTKSKEKNITASNSSTRFASNRPVIVFLSGGAWIIGYKAWGALMGKVLSHFGVVVVTPDYRNFPQGILPDMVDDATMAMQWVFDNIHYFGGNPENVTLVGQSAGAHIAMCTLLEQVEQRKRFGRRSSVSMVPSPTYSSSSFRSATSNSAVDNFYQAPTWELKHLRSVIGISGPYNIEASIETFHKHGFDKSVVERIMNNGITYFSPALRVFAYAEHALAHELLQDFPPVYLFHGTADNTVNWKSSEQFAHALEASGLSVHVQYFKDKSHTDPIIEDPICGDDFLIEQILKILKECAPDEHQKQFTCGYGCIEKRSYYPEILVRLARYLNPF